MDVNDRNRGNFIRGIYAMSQTFHRGRRLRWTRELRTLVRETPPLLVENLIMPYFVVETGDQSFRKEVSSMPGQYQLSLDALEKQVEQAVDTGLTAVLLFGIPARKDEKASGAYAEDGIVQQAVRRLKARWPKLLVITDVCLCEYMSHGHCGVLMPDGAVLNDPTLPLLARTAVSHAAAGADMVAPSDMMDGRVAAIRQALDEGGLKELPIMSYAREIRLGLLRAFPRRGRVGSGRRGSQVLSDGPRQRPRGLDRSPRGSGRRRGRADRQARRAVFRHHPSGARAGGRAALRLSGQRRVCHDPRRPGSTAGSTSALSCWNLCWVSSVRARTC